MKLFLTKTWGWYPEGYPTFGFSKEGARDNFLRQSAPGDWIVIAGTRSDPTLPEEQGKLLGMCQVGRDKVDADAIMKMIGTPLSDLEVDENGIYIWRWAMPIVKAVYFTDPKPDLRDIAGSYIPGQEWAVYARDVKKELGQEIFDKLCSLPTRPAEIKQIPILEREAVYAKTMELHRKYGLSGPPPSGTRSGSQREMGLGYAYAFLLRGGKYGDAIKIGSSYDPDQRLKKLNAEIRPHLTGCKWTQLIYQVFPSETYAYRFEQLLLRRLRDMLIPGDREVIRSNLMDFNRVWVDTLYGKHWTEELNVK